MKIKSGENNCDKLVSVIVPVYNVEKYLAECLDSLQAQTYPHWEAICVNDGSTDNSWQILQKYAARDSRFVIINQKNSGVSATRNAALQKAKGDYIAFLDSDDMLYCQFMEYMAAALEKTNSDIAVCGYENRGNNVKKCRYRQCELKELFNPISYFLKRKKPKLQIAVWGKLYKREILDDLLFSADFKQMAEDYYYSFLVFERVKKIVCVKDKLLFYRQTESSLTHQKFSEREINDHILLAQKIMTHFATMEDIKCYELMKKDFSKIIFRQCCSYPYFKNAGYQSYWQKYQKICLNLAEQKVFFPHKLSLFNQFLCKMFLQGNFSRLAFWLKIYQKVHGKI